MGRSGIFQAAVGKVAAVTLLASATTVYAYTGDQEQACAGDAFRLCASDIPNVDRITACMIRRQAELSPGCRVFFQTPEPVATRETLRPSRERRHPHVRKPHKAHHKPHHRS